MFEIPFFVRNSNIFLSVVKNLPNKNKRTWKLDVIDLNISKMPLEALKNYLKIFSCVENNFLLLTFEFLI